MNSSFEKKIVIGSLSLIVLVIVVSLLQKKVSFKSTQVNYQTSSYPSVKLPPKPPKNLKKAHKKIDVFLAPKGKKVGYLIPGQSFWLTNERKDGFIKIRGERDNEFLWIQEKDLQ